MKRIPIIIFLLLCPICSSVWGQTSWQHYYEILVENGEEEEENLQLIYEALSDAATNPININTITSEQLRDLLCFNEEQIENIVGFVQRYGPLRTKGELAMIPYLDNTLSGLLSELTYIGQDFEKDFTYIDSLKFKYGEEKYRYALQNQDKRGDVTASTHIPFYTRRGDKDGYHGSSIKHWFRAKYKITNNISAGVVASQDAGEPLFSQPNRYGYDFYSGYVKLQRLKKIKNLVIGQYRIRSGMGLILNNNLMFGKSFSTMTLGNIGTTTILPHSSRSESNYLQGIAGTFSLSKQLEISAFASFRHIDATLTDEGDGIKTIVKTGYHRTESELQRRHNASQTTVGTNIRFTQNNIFAGMTVVYNHFSLPLQPVSDPIPLSQLYRRFAPTGQEFLNVSADYGYNFGKTIRFYGETGTDNNMNIATTNTISWHANKSLTFRAIQRFYPYRFNAIMGQSFSEGGSNQDESGIYVGTEWNPSARLSLMAYSDIAYFAWPKYQALGSSHSFDNLIQANYKLSPQSQVNVRYRIKLRQKDADTDAGYNKGDLVYKDEQRLRLFLLTRSGRLSWKSQVDMTLCKYKDTSFGAMASQTVTYSAKPFNITSGISYFHTKDYNSRVYAYEQSTPYNLSFPSFYGHGIRAYCVGQAELIKRLSLIMKLGFTKYFDRNEIGSGMQLINSSHQLDLNLMLRCTF